MVIIIFITRALLKKDLGEKRTRALLKKDSENKFSDPLKTIKVFKGLGEKRTRALGEEKLKQNIINKQLNKLGNCIRVK